MPRSRIRKKPVRPTEPKTDSAISWRKYLGWLSLVFVPIAGVLISSIEHDHGFVYSSDAPGVLYCLALAAGLATLVLTAFHSTVTKVICSVFYILIMPIVLMAIDISINGLHLRLF
jgi:hypothetical protein